MLMLYAEIHNKENPYNFSTFFADAVLPVGIDYEILCGEILLKFGAWPTIVSRTSEFKYLSDNFFKSNINNFTRLVEALNAEYNPIENYDRFESWGDKAHKEHVRTNKDTNSGVDRTEITTNGKDITTTNESGNDTRTTTPSGDETTTNYVSAFNSAPNTWSDSEKTVINRDGMSTTELRTPNLETTNTLQKGSGSNENLTHGHIIDTNESNNGDEQSTHNGHIHGNIGVTTNQQMVRSEVELRLRSAYEYIADEWGRRLTIGYL